MAGLREVKFRAFIYNEKPRRYIQVVIQETGDPGIQGKGRLNNPNSPHSVQAVSPSTPGRNPGKVCTRRKEQ